MLRSLRMRAEQTSCARHPSVARMKAGEIRDAGHRVNLHPFVPAKAGIQFLSFWVPRLRGDEREGACLKNIARMERSEIPRRWRRNPFRYLSYEAPCDSDALILKTAFTKTFQVVDEFASGFNPRALAVARSIQQRGHHACIVPCGAYRRHRYRNDECPADRGRGPVRPLRWTPRCRRRAACSRRCGRPPPRCCGWPAPCRGALKHPCGVSRRLYQGGPASLVRSARFFTMRGSRHRGFL